MVDQTRFEIIEGAPSRTAGIDHGGDTIAEQPIRHHAVIVGKGAPRSVVGINMRVDVNQPGRDDEARDVGRLEGEFGIDIGSDGRDPPVAMATSRTASMPFFPSMTWPPFSSRS
jgi:hypothetical protein